MVGKQRAQGNLHQSNPNHAKAAL